MKKRAAAAAAALLLFLSLCLPARAADVYIYGFFRYTLEDQSVTITRYTGREAEVTVPAMMGGNPVNTIGAGAFADNALVTRVILPDTITRVEEGAFAAGQTAVFSGSPDPAGTAGIGGIRRTEDGLRVELSGVPAGANAVCAAYDGAGKLLAAEVRTLTDGQDACAFSVGAAPTVRVFLLDAGWRPLCESRTE